MKRILHPLYIAGCALCGSAGANATNGEWIMATCLFVAGFCIMLYSGFEVSANGTD